MITTTEIINLYNEYPEFFAATIKNPNNIINFVLASNNLHWAEVIITFFHKDHGLPMDAPSKLFFSTLKSMNLAASDDTANLKVFDQEYQAYLSALKKGPEEFQTYLKSDATLMKFFDDHIATMRTIAAHYTLEAAKERTARHQRLIETTLNLNNIKKVYEKKYPDYRPPQSRNEDKEQLAHNINPTSCNEIIAQVKSVIKIYSPERAFTEDMIGHLGFELFLQKTLEQTIVNYFLLINANSIIKKILQQQFSQPIIQNGFYNIKEVERFILAQQFQERDFASWIDETVDYLRMQNKTDLAYETEFKEHLYRRIKNTMDVISDLKDVGLLKKLESLQPMIFNKTKEPYKSFFAEKNANYKKDKAVIKSNKEMRKLLNTLAHFCRSIKDDTINKAAQAFFNTILDLTKKNSLQTEKTIPVFLDFIIACPSFFEVYLRQLQDEINEQRLLNPKDSIIAPPRNLQKETHMKIITFIKYMLAGIETMQRADRNEQEPKRMKPSII